MINLKSVLDDFKKRNIIVLGDVMLDKYTWGVIERINPEAPAHLIKVIDETYELGGAGNVARNLVSLGASCTLYGIIGEDLHGEKIKELCGKEDIEYNFFYLKEGTLVKQRGMASGYELIRLDYGEKNLRKIDVDTQHSILEDLKHKIESKKYDAIIMSDYNKRFFAKDVSEGIISLANANNLRTFVDPKPININYFKKCTLVCPNKKESSEITKIEYSRESLKIIGRDLCERLDSEYSIVTCSEEGVFVCSKGGSKMIETTARKVSSPAGAGDTFIATLALAMSSGADILSSAELANYAAGIVVEKPGTATTTVEEIMERLKGRF